LLAKRAAKGVRTALMPSVVQRRGSVIEAEHPFSAVAVDASGATVALLGEDRETSFRSAAKPFQLAVSLEALGDPEHDDADLAIGAASHGGEPMHVARVEALLARYGLTESALRCGSHWPYHAPSTEALMRAGANLRPAFSNCSGKHTFMLAASRALGAPDDYLPEAHPLQRRNTALVTRLAGAPRALGVDGCGVPTYALPLSGLARAWAVLAEAMRSDAAGDRDTARLGRIARAMARHPELTSGAGRLDVAIVRGAREALAVKVGALGVFCIALPERRLGLAVKVHSGNGEALPLAVATALGRLAPGAFQAPERWGALEIRSVAGSLVGSFELG
jgi:L-asparaginase II